MPRAPRLAVFCAAGLAAGLALVAFPVAAQTNLPSPALDGEGSSSQSISAGQGAVEVTIDLEGDLDTTGDGLRPEGGGSLDIGVGDTEIGIGSPERGTPVGGASAPDGSGEMAPEMAPSTGGPGGVGAAGGSGAAPGTTNPAATDPASVTCDMLEDIAALSPAEISQVNSRQTIVLVQGCASAVPFSRPHRDALAANAYFTETLTRLGVLANTVQTIARSNHGELFIFLA